MKMKKCNKCNVDRPLSEFQKDKGKSDGLSSTCKICRKEWRDANKKRIKEHNERYKEENPDYYSTYRENNTEERKEYNRKHREENPEHYSKYRKEYHKNNPDYTKEYHRKRRAEDPLFRLTGNIRCLTKAALRERGFTKKSKTHEILGCSYEYLKEKLEDNPYGFTVDDHTIDIDHIIPLISAKNEVELLRLCKVDNLQLLPSFYNQNIKKDKRFNREHFHAWMEKMNL